MSLQSGQHHRVDIVGGHAGSVARPPRAELGRNWGVVAQIRDLVPYSGATANVFLNTGKLIAAGGERQPWRTVSCRDSGGNVGANSHGGVSTVIDDEMMSVFVALDGQRQELILICSQFLLEEQQEDERDRLAAPVRADTHLVAHLAGIPTTRGEIGKLGAVGTPGVARVNHSGARSSFEAASRRAPVGQQSGATMVRGHP